MRPQLTLFLILLFVTPALAYDIEGFRGDYSVTSGVTTAGQGTWSAQVAPDVSVSGEWRGIRVLDDPSKARRFSWSITQSGTAATGRISDGKGTGTISGTLINGSLSLTINEGDGSTIILTGLVHADGTMSGQFSNRTNGTTGKWGAAPIMIAPVGVTGKWSVNHSSCMGHGWGSETMYLNQYGGIVLGLTASGTAIDGTISGTSITLSFPDGDGSGGTVTATETTNSATAPTTMSGTYKDYAGVPPSFRDEGSWSAARPAPSHALAP